ncbi:TcpQ domain-containing protein [Acetobacter lambici]|uniref:Toxin co-regulated pilus biosynthesis Q family protein n=1 Tax=Acetobacter lambici TaxID=1332824 RepID=A0ABT1F176_9PROT|nr:toxin co-regulated pilus biosynthesis Q family protein [Acetobacter lambici]MCP1258953.1 toxin co-regulated pilus biosynthesis Q family protein [Acetobacter lambici]
MNRLTRHITTGALLVLVSGCGEMPPSTSSHVAGATFRDASALTVFIADILANSMDGPNSIIRLAPYDGPDPNHTEVLLMDTLRERGFALSPDGMSYPGAHTVRYAVSPVGQNLLLELDADDAEATCLYGHNADGALERAGSCTIHNGQHLILKIPNTDQMRPIPLKPTNTQPALAQAKLPSEEWTLVEGQPIREQMVAWGDRAGWKVFWPHDLNWMVPAMTSFNGDYQKVMTDIIHTISDEGKSIHADFHTPNHTLVVTSPGGRSE